MTTVKYVTSSGKSYDLITSTGFRLRNANFHKWSWGRDVKTRRFGEKILQFTRQPLQYDCTLTFYGPTDRRARQIDELHNDFDRDIAMMTPGRIYWGSCYIECYAQTSSTYPGEGNNWTENDVTFYCPYPFWIEEQTIDIFPLSGGGGESEEGVKTYEADDYGYFYSYDYAQNGRVVKLTVDHYMDSDFRLVAHGPALSLSVEIAGHLYEVDHEIDTGEYMVIDSRSLQPADKRIYLVGTDGSETNLFDYRDPATSVFRKIPPGPITVDYSRAYGITLTIYKERSEPR